MAVVILKHSVSRPHGTLIVTNRDSGRDYQRDYLQCCHCQFVWLVQPGSGIQRGYCTLCGQVTCGRDCCQRCTPFERRLEQYEAGRQPIL